MRRVAEIALGLGLPLALFCGVASLGTVGYGQDRGIFGRDRSIFEQDRERSGLPFGSTLLKADEAECRGALLASGLGRNGEDVHGIRQGEDQVFRITEQNVPWACLGAESARSGTMKCPSGTTDVRIGHDGNVARFECYGADR